MVIEKKQLEKFRKKLLAWNQRANDRAMPWKGEKDPYRIWLSEIMLQQTRVEQGMGYYRRFLTAYPDVKQLARAPEKDVMKLWEGLGYYSRCRNLIHTARYIAGECGGVFPSSYDAIRGLKGVGPYTAAAIASFAFNLPHAVVDGNVIRLLSRVFGIDAPADTAEGKKIFTDLAEAALDPVAPGTYNQAIMDFGATICKPLAPSCPQCPLHNSCYAFTSGRVADLPAKKKKTAVRKRWFYYLVMEYRGKIAIRERGEKDIWRGLYEFPMVEMPAEKTTHKVLQAAVKAGLLEKGNFILTHVTLPRQQQLSHQLIRAVFLRIQLNQSKPADKQMKLVPKRKLAEFPFPRVIHAYLQQDSMEQSLF